jgi:hypothetical protein
MGRWKLSTSVSKSLKSDSQEAAAHNIERSLLKRRKYE